MTAAASGLLYGANIRANGIRQHYLRFGGAGPALVIVPGITTAAAQWAFVAERLCTTFDTYILDVRGRGLSESGPHLDYSLDACAADVVAFAAVLGLEKYTLMGHSMGARIGIRAVRQQPGAIDQLVLIDPPVSGPGRRAYPIPLAPLMALLHAAKRGDADSALRGPAAPKWPEVHIKVRAEWLHTCDERAIIESYRGFHEDDIHADLPHLSVPTALMIAGKGGVISHDDEAEIRELLPSIAITRVEGAGHQIQVDDIEGFLSALFDMLGPESRRTQDRRC
ncbi:MAG: alpha/beta fold hydrolase [Afipia sp.]